MLPPHYPGMDQDQDLLDKLDRQQSPAFAALAVLVGGIAALAGTVAYFTMVLEPNASKELALSAGATIAISSAAALTVAFRKLR